MDPKPPTSSVSLYKEVRTSLPAQSIIQLQLPSTSSFSVRSRQQRRVVRTPTRCKDEETFKNNYLANSGSLFFGKSKRYPQNFLWRVLGDGRVLELRSADLSKSNGESREASLSLHLYFPGALKYGCVALADSDEDILNIFALTRANELYTIALRKDFFCHVAASDEDVSRWCKTIKPSSFSISTPHRLIVSSTLELIISLSDGRLLRLNREKGDDGSKWAETCYGDAQWASSLRGLVRWQGSNTVKYDDTILEQGTPTAIAVSPDRNHTFAVCLNHQLRVWNPNNGNCVFSKDLLWVHRERHEIPKMMLDPGSSNFLQIFQSDGAVEGDLYYAVTFSPHDLGQFKFWGVRDPDYGEGGIRDLFPDCPLKPPDPDPTPESKAIWKVADFKVKSGRTGKGLEMWILMQSNRSYKLYGLTFDILDLAVVWQDQWFTMASETHGHGQQPQVSSLDPKDATDKWLDFIFSASEIPDSVLETALSMYNSEGSVAPSDTNASLKERSCAAIGSQVGSMMSGITPSSYRKIVDQEWTRLWQYIRDLNRTRWHILSLSYDNNVGMPWIAFADGCSAIRTCDKIEIMTQNSPRVLAGSLGMLEAPSIEMDPANDPKLPDELAVLIQAATGFRRNFSYALQRTCRSILAEELWLNPTNSIPLRIQSFYDRCNFAEEIDTVRFEELAKALDRIGGFDCLETGTFFAILDELVYSLPLEGSGLLHTNFGRSLLINGAREMIDQRQGMLYDLLTFIVFVDMEIDREEMPMENFDAPQIYSRLLDLLKQYRISQWLAESTRIEKPSSLTRPSSSHMPKEQFSSSPPGRTSTILESLFALDLSAQSHKDQSQSEALTYSIKDLLQWVVGGNDPDVSLDDVPVYIQTDLLAHHDIDLACDFVRYQPSTAWSAYIKGRLSLMKGDVTEAAIHFKKAAFKLSRPSTFDYSAAANSLLKPMEAAYFGNGLPTYYTHILNLFDTHSYPTQMAQFAHLALQHISTSESTNHDQNTTLLTSLFQASLQTTDFSTAFSALTRHPNPETLLPSLLSSILTTPNALPQLLSLPFPPNMHTQIDEILSSSPNHKPAPKILAAWRLHHNDFRGAAAALLPPLQASQAKVKRNADGLENDYLTVINLLACAGEEKGWVLSAGAADAAASGKGKRKVITIGDVRGSYQRELDRKSVIESGRFSFAGEVAGGDEMDVL